MMYITKICVMLHIFYVEFNEYLNPSLTFIVRSIYMSVLLVYVLS